MRSWLVRAKGEGMKGVLKRPEDCCCQADRWRFQLSKGSDGRGVSGAPTSVMFISHSQQGAYAVTHDIERMNRTFERGGENV